MTIILFGAVGTLISFAIISLGIFIQQLQIAFCITRMNYFKNFNAHVPCEFGRAPILDALCDLVYGLIRKNAV